MSANFQPFIDIPYPNFAMEELLDANRVVPVPEVTPAPAVRPVGSPANRAPGEEVVAPDAAEVSSAGRRLAEAGVQSQETLDRLALARSARNNLGIRSLIASFQGYDNSAAQRQFEKYLRVFTSYAGNPGTVQPGDSAVAEVRSQMDAVYAGLGFLNGGEGGGRYVRGRMAEAIDAWLSGDGVFVPSMLAYSSSDGFRFSPLSAASRASLRAADTLASYERTRVAQYLREMAALTPEDFMFYDPTGLDSLALNERREFLRRMDQLLEQARIDARAADLRYVFNEEGELALDELGLDNEEEIRRLEALQETINSYYAMLTASVQQYGSGIISSNLS